MTLLPRRYVVAVMGFFGFFHLYVLRVNLSIAIIAMTANRSSTDSNGTVTYVSQTKPFFFSRI